MRRQSFTITASIIAAGFLITPASASYMSNCEKLISAWDECRASGLKCQAEQKALETECKCHKQKGEEWKLVIAAVGKDGVCAPPWPDTPVPDPSPPRHDDPDHQPDDKSATKKEERNRRQ